MALGADIMEGCGIISNKEHSLAKGNKGDTVLAIHMIPKRKHFNASAARWR